MYVRSGRGSVWGTVSFAFKREALKILSMGFFFMIHKFIMIREKYFEGHRSRGCKKKKMVSWDLDFWGQWNANNFLTWPFWIWVFVEGNFGSLGVWFGIFSLLLSLLLFGRSFCRHCILWFGELLFSLLPVIFLLFLGGCGCIYLDLDLELYL